VQSGVQLPCMAGDAAGAVRCACRASPRAQLSCGRLPPSRFIGRLQGSAWRPLLQQHKRLLLPTQRRGRHAALSDVLRWLPLPGQADDSSSDGSGSGSRTNGDGSPIPTPQLAPAFANAGGDGAGYASGCVSAHQHICRLHPSNEQACLARCWLLFVCWRASTCHGAADWDVLWLSQPTFTCRYVGVGTPQTQRPASAGALLQSTISALSTLSAPVSADLNSDGEVSKVSVDVHIVLP
jgi:hypothetical protein